MKLIVSPFKQCYENIASEEFLIETIADDIFLLYINKPSIIVGNNQNTYAEINHEFVENAHIDVVRRRSGGGAVYHDKGNLNFCFIMKRSNKDSHTLFKDFTAPIIQALQSMGVNAKFSGRNDLTIDNKKFSGNAQWHTTDRSLIHGTLLFDSDLTVLSKALKANELKFTDKAIKSIRSRVTNIRPYLKDSFDMNTFIQKIITEVEVQFEYFENYHYTETEIHAIKELAKNKYATHTWNYGNSPKFTYSHKFKYEKGNVEVGANVNKGQLTEVKIFGDFFGVNPNLSEIESALMGCIYEKSALLNALNHLKVSDYIDGLSEIQLVDSFFTSDDK